MIDYLVVFLIGGVVASLLGLIYIKYFRGKKVSTETKSIFNLTPYTSQQISKLFGEKMIANLINQFNIKSVNETVLPLKFQSQWCEDILLFNCFKEKRTGFYIEIGAFDGVRLSNTYFFECIGWTGLLVEPQPKQFEKLRINRPNSICENVCISENTNDAILNIVEQEDYQTWSYISKDDNQAQENIGFETKKISVKCRTINELLPDNITKVDFLSIDVEGMELEVLKTFDVKKYNPEIILLENPNNEINAYLLDFGYRPFVKTWINYLYTKNVEQYQDLDIYKYLGIEIKG